MANQAVPKVIMGSYLLMRTTLIWVACLCLTAHTALAQAISPKLEFVKIDNLNATSQTINLVNSYTVPVIVCSYAVKNTTAPIIGIRLSGINATNFKIKMKRYDGGTLNSTTHGYCMIAEKGAYNQNGLKYEARKAYSNDTAGKNQPNDWEGAAEDVTSYITQTYTDPIIFGQVMTINDARPSAFWTSACTNRNNRPLPTTSVCIGKHAGTSDRNYENESLGFIVIEGGTRTVNGIKMKIGIGSQTVQGVLDAPPYNYDLGEHFEKAIVTQSRMRGSDGSAASFWAQYPLSGNTLKLVVEENSPNRKHDPEQVAYWAVKNLQAPNVQASKTVTPINSVAYSLPDTEVLYSLSVQNTGSAAVDANTIVIIGEIAPHTVFFYRRY